MKQRKTPRAQWYDYTSSWGYFITICAKDREHYFGEIIDNKIILNELGKHIHNEIWRLSERKTVDIHERIVMPNHIHLLLVISNLTQDMNTWYDRRDAFVTHPLSNGNGQVTNLSLHIGHDDYPWPRLWQIIGVLKSNITKYANKHDIIFARQWRYHDHIIRNEDEYNRIKYYIQSNPQNRESDSLHWW
jgi:REP element-mobilizing transposase RayT